jgi:hypothetical protein
MKLECFLRKVPMSFSGTSQPALLTPKRLKAARQVLAIIWPTVLIHGMAIGADSAIDAIARELHLPRKGHPSNKDSVKFIQPETITPVRPVAERDRNIVQEGQLLLVMPPTDFELEKSGTWNQMRYNRQLGKPLIWIMLDGTVAEFMNGDWHS